MSADAPGSAPRSSGASGLGSFLPNPSGWWGRAAELLSQSFSSAQPFLRNAVPAVGMVMLKSAFDNLQQSRQWNYQLAHYTESFHVDAEISKLCHRVEAYQMHYPEAYRNVLVHLSRLLTLEDGIRKSNRPEPGDLALMRVYLHGYYSSIAVLGEHIPTPAERVTFERARRALTARVELHHKSLIRRLSERYPYLKKK